MVDENCECEGCQCDCEVEEPDCMECEGCLEHQDACPCETTDPEEVPWGAHPCGEVAPFKIGAEAVMLKMHTEEGEAVEVNLLQVVNQMFLDMGALFKQMQMLQRVIMGAVPEGEEEEKDENPLILMPNTDIEVV